jgi:hypothetical protein
MKKIAFMFVAAALFAACGEKKAPAQEAEVAEPEVVEAVATAEDSAAALALVEAIEDSLVKDSCFKVALDSIVAAKAAVAEDTTKAEAAE